VDRDSPESVQLLATDRSADLCLKAGKLLVGHHQKIRGIEME
jgi:hypothetical protein